MTRAHNLAQMIRRIRRNNSNVKHGNYLTLSDINIPIELLETIKSKQLFLWDDSGKEDS